MHVRTTAMVVATLFLLVPILATDTLAKKPPPPPPPSDPDPAVAWTALQQSGQGYTGQVWVMNADGSSPTLVYAASVQMGVGGVDWSPDGQELAFSMDGAIHVIGVDGTGLRAVTATAAPTVSLAWSPAAVPGPGNDEECIAYCAALGQNTLSLVALDGSPHLTLATFSYAANFPTWSPSATRLAVELNPPGSGPQVWGLYTFSAGGGSAAEIPHQGPLASVGYCGTPAWAKTQEDKIAWAAGTNDFDLYVVDLDEPASPVRLTATTDAFEYHPTWSPDDQRILFLSQTTSRRRSVTRAEVVDAADGSGRQVVAKIASRAVWRRNP